ncbi:hypothetical protein [Amycolatopsis methanolica]|nr:hypothetical protein [Amycolatopsis methanolica]
MTGDLVRARRAVSVVFAACGAAFGTWLARVPAVQDRLGLTTGQLAAGLLGLAAGSVVALLLAGAVIMRIGSRAAAVVGAVVLCGGLPLVAVAPGAPAFVAALVVLGVGNSTLDVAMNAHAARVEDGYGRPIFAGFHAFWNIGGLAGSGADALAEAWHVPVAVHFPVAGGVLLAVALVAVLGGFLRGPDRGQGGPAFAWPGRALVPLGVIAFCGFVAEGAVNSWGAVYLSEVTAAGPAVASLGYFAFSVTMIVVRLGADRVVGRIGAVVFLRLASVVAVGGFAVVGAGVAGIVPVAWSAAGRAAPAAPGRAVAAVAACGYAGFLVEPVVIGAIATWGGLRWGLVSAVAVTGVVAVLARGVGAGRGVG